MLEIHEKLYIGDVVEMRKQHPCGGWEWEIVRVGADIGLSCCTCGRRVLLPRRKFAAWRQAVCQAKQSGWGEPIQVRLSLDIMAFSNLIESKRPEQPEP